MHCLSSSGRRDPRELTTDECKAVIDELERMQVFYVNIGGGEPTVRSDFWELVDYATEHHVGVKFSTNGVKITPEVAQRLAASDYVDVQISLDGATADVNDAVRGRGSYDTALRAMQNLRDAGFRGFKISVVMTRHNVGQLDEFKAIADRFDAQLRITRLRPSGRGADVWDDLHVTAQQQRELYDWLVLHGENVLTGDSFFHLAGYGDALPGLNLCGAGRVVCLIDPVGDVYACPFAIHENFLAGNVRAEGGFTAVWRSSELFASLRSPQTGGACTSCSAFDACRGGCMAAKFFTGLPLDGPDPECVKGHGETRAGRGRPRRRTEAVARPFAPPAAADRAHPAREGLRRESVGRCSRRWVTSRRSTLRAATAILAVPLGSTEQHGAHLPLSTDTDIASRCARAGRCSRRRRRRTGRALRIERRARRIRRNPVYRARRSSSLWWSSSPALPPTPSTHVLFVSAHGGNTRAGHARGRSAARRRPRRLAVPAGVGRRPHAGHVETSLQLLLRPDVVRTDRAVVGDTRPLAELMPPLRAGGVLAVTATGRARRPDRRIVEAGRGFFAALVADLIEHVATLAARPDEHAPSSPGRRAGSVQPRFARSPRRAGPSWPSTCASDDPALPYPLATRADLDALRRVRRCIRSWPTCATKPRSPPPSPRPKRASAGSMPRSPRPASSPAALRTGRCRSQQQQAVLDVNLGGVLTLARVAIPALLRRPEPRNGRFLAVASAAATQGCRCSRPTARRRPA